MAVRCLNVPRRVLANNRVTTTQTDRKDTSQNASITESRSTKSQRDSTNQAAKSLLKMCVVFSVCGAAVLIGDYNSYSVAYDSFARDVWRSFDFLWNRGIAAYRIPQKMKQPVRFSL